MNKILTKEVSFEVAKLLKEKDYDVKDRENYQMYGVQIIPQLELYNDTKWNIYKDYCLAPTIAEVLDWIYSKTGDWFSIDSENNKTFYYYVPKEGEINFSKEYPTILETYENAIKYSLNKML